MSKKDYTVKFDVNIWFDRNFTIQANSQEEAEEKAEQLMNKIEDDFNNTMPTNGSVFDTSDPKQFLSEFDQWVFGDCKLDTVYVEED